MKEIEGWRTYYGEPEQGKPRHKKTTQDPLRRYLVAGTPEVVVDSYNSARYSSEKLRYMG